MINLLIIIVLVGVIAYFILGKKRIKEILTGMFAVAVVSTGAIDDAGDTNTTAEHNTTTIEQKNEPRPLVKPVPAMSITAKNKVWQSLKTEETRFSTVIKSDRTDTVIGLSTIQAKAYSDLACIVRFNPTGTIDVRDYDAYKSDVRMAYKKNKKYTFIFEVNMQTHTYSVSVQEEDKKYVPIASDYRFRKEQSRVNKLNYISSYSQASQYSKVIKNNLIYDASYKKGVPKYIDVELVSKDETISTTTDENGYFQTYVKPESVYRVVAIEDNHRFIQKDLRNNVLTWHPIKSHQ